MGGQEQHPVKRQREERSPGAAAHMKAHKWAKSDLNATPPDGFRAHQRIGIEGMAERMADEDPENRRRREFVKSMMKSAWRGYNKCVPVPATMLNSYSYKFWCALSRYAWGENELNPKAKKGHSASVFGKTKMGATLIDALDTLMIMNLTEEVAQARAWIEKDLHFTGSTYVSVFEVRYLQRGIRFRFVS